MSGNNSFWNNSALYARHYVQPSQGGALKVYEGTLTISGNASISHCKASLGGAIYMMLSQAVLYRASLVLQENVAASDGGGMWIQLSSVITLTGYLRFIGNTADGAGGAVCIDNLHDSHETEKEKEQIVLSGDFVNNSAYYVGGAVYASSAQITLTDTTMIGNLGIAMSVSNSNVTFNGTTRVSSHTGGAVSAEESSIVFEDDAIFDSNSSPDGGALNCMQGAVYFRDGRTLFVRNHAYGNGGAFYAVGTSIYIQGGHVNFTLNTALKNGGAMYFDTGATMTLKTFTASNTASSQLSTSHNFASQYGGGIYHVDNPTTHQCTIAVSLDEFKKTPYCFLRLVPYEYDNLPSIGINSHNDSAGMDGNFLYGGLLDRCKVNSDWTTGAELYIDEIITYELSANNAKEIKSEPYHLCFCINNETALPHVICRKTLNIEVHRGQKFSVPLLAVAQVGTTSTTVTAISSPKAKLEIYQTSQPLSEYCSLLSYTVYSIDSHEEVVLYPDGPCRDSGQAKVIINVTLSPCPDGFAQFAEICTCEQRLHHHDISCIVSDVPHMRKAAGSVFWMGVLYTNTTYEGLILGTLCPAEYCKTESVNITLNNSDVQCDLHRGGLLCGGCAANHSLMLGSSQCQICHNTHLALILPFAVAGIALVAFFVFLKLTIATGSLNSVILYANIVQVNRKLFFPVNTRNVLTVFIAWMNLDFGFQTCFYDGLDAYAQTWLQFAFPLYVWLLIGLIILISRYSITVSKLIGHNPIAVLATLLLMSYTKILKTIIEVYSSAELGYPGNKTVIVWLKDANVPYLQSKHLFLTIVTSLVLIFLFLPYTLLLLLGHKLYRLSGRKCFSWLNRMKPLLDSYYAPYKTHTRYWTGFLLLVRCTLYIVFLFNSLSANKTFLAITLTFTILGFTMGMVYAGRIYRKFYINLIEAGTYLNLILLSTIASTGLCSRGVVYSLVGMSLITMVFICVYQCYLLHIAKTPLWHRLEQKWSHYRPKLQGTGFSGSVPPPMINTSHDPHKIITKTVIELREPLIES